MKTFLTCVFLLILHSSVGASEKASQVINGAESKTKKVNSGSKKNSTPIPPSKSSVGFFSAAQQANFEIMDVYLSQGADINCVTCDSNGMGRTPLLEAMVNKIYFAGKFVRYMIEHGADINRQDKSGVTPLMVAISSDSDSVIEGGIAPIIDDLLRSGARVDLEDVQGNSAINYVSSYNATISRTTVLLKFGANINHQSKKTQMTLLMAASRDCAKPEVLKYLLSEHANTLLKNAEGKTAYDLALEQATKDRNPNCNLAVSILGLQPH